MAVVHEPQDQTSCSWSTGDSSIQAVVLFDFDTLIKTWSTFQPVTSLRVIQVITFLITSYISTWLRSLCRSPALVPWRTWRTRLWECSYRLSWLGSAWLPWICHPADWFQMCLNCNTVSLLCKQDGVISMPFDSLLRRSSNLNRLVLMKLHRLFSHKVSDKWLKSATHTHTHSQSVVENYWTNPWGLTKFRHKWSWWSCSLWCIFTDGKRLLHCIYSLDPPSSVVHGIRRCTMLYSPHTISLHPQWHHGMHLSSDSIVSAMVHCFGYVLGELTIS